MSREDIENGFYEYGIKYLRTRVDYGYCYQIYDDETWTAIRNSKGRSYVYNFKGVK